MKSVCVYCGSSPGRSGVYLSAARDLGAEIGRRGLTLVYGGSSIGLMGEIAHAALQAGGRVVGVIPKALADEKIAFEGLTDLRVAKDMHERKALMAELSDGFIALPGGYGTYEEFFEALTWLQLGIHAKPCGVLNVNGYYNQLLAFLDHAVDEGFLHKPHRSLILSAERADALLDALNAFHPVLVSKTEWAQQMGRHRK